MLPTTQKSDHYLTTYQWTGLQLVYACLDTCCRHFLTIIAGVDLHFRHESELPVCRTQVAAMQGEAANHYTYDAGRDPGGEGVRVKGTSDWL